MASAAGKRNKSPPLPEEDPSSPSLFLELPAELLDYIFDLACIGIAPQGSPCRALYPFWRRYRLARIRIASRATLGALGKASSDALVNVQHLSVSVPLRASFSELHRTLSDCLLRLFPRLRKVHTLTVETVGQESKGQLFCLMNTNLLKLLPALRRIELIDTRSSYSTGAYNRPDAYPPLPITSFASRGARSSSSEAEELLPRLHSLEELELHAVLSDQDFEQLVALLPTLRHLRRLAIKGNSRIHLKRHPTLPSRLPSLERIDIGEHVSCSDAFLAALLQASPLAHIVLGPHNQQGLAALLGCFNSGINMKQLKRLTLDTLMPAVQGETADKVNFDVENFDESWPSPFFNTQRRDYDVLLVRAEAAGIKVDGTDLAVLANEDAYLAERERLDAVLRERATEQGAGLIFEKPLSPRRARA
ncbi:hypothetical protein JCM10207_004319 [Rhodosporidiobolus poonsookiae]